MKHIKGELHGIFHFKCEQYKFKAEIEYKIDYIDIKKTEFNFLTSDQFKDIIDIKFNDQYIFILD